MNDVKAAAYDIGLRSADDLIAMLKIHGLSLVTAEERAVLDASAAVRDDWLTCCTSPSCDHIRPWVAAELRRRDGEAMKRVKAAVALCDFEYRVLAMLDGIGAPIPWGAAVGAALGSLKGSGCVSFNGIGYDITDRGRDALAARAMLGGAR